MDLNKKKKKKNKFRSMARLVQKHLNIKIAVYCEM